MTYCIGEPNNQEHDKGVAWLVLLLCFYCGFITIGFSYASGIYQQPWLNEFNLTDISTVTGVGSGNAQVGMTFLACPVATLLYHSRFGPRTNLYMGSFLTVGGYLAASLATSIYVLYVTYSFTVGLGMSCFYYTMGVLPKSWFKVREVFAMGVACAGSAWATMVTVPVLSEVIKAAGWRNSLRVQAACTGVLLLAAILLPDPPTDKRLKEQPPPRPFREKKYNSRAEWVWAPLLALVLLALIITLIILVAKVRAKRATGGTYNPSQQEFVASRVEMDDIFKPPPEERLI